MPFSLLFFCIVVCQTDQPDRQDAINVPYFRLHVYGVVSERFQNRQNENNTFH